MSLKNNPTSRSSIIRIGLTIGDPRGIGPAITLKAVKALKGKADITVIGSRFVLDKAAKMLKVKTLPEKLIDLDNVDKKSFRFSGINAAGGRASLEYLDVALELLQANKLDCLVTNPVSKEAINLSLDGFCGHTEYLAAKAGAKNPLMLLLNDQLKFSLVTRHIALKEVCVKYTARELKENISGTIKGLTALFLISRPRVVVCGVNPHASDNGVIGSDEQTIISPVIKDLRKKLKNAIIAGPLAADTAISQAVKGNYDCVIAAYHDQALIALKLTDFNSGVNLTLGLPFVRTSPLHGTAFDIANKPQLANPASLLSAIRLAIKCTLNQKKA